MPFSFETALKRWSGKTTNPPMDERITFSARDEKIVRRVKGLDTQRVRAQSGRTTEKGVERVTIHVEQFARAAEVVVKAYGQR